MNREKRGSICSRCFFDMIRHGLLMLAFNVFVANFMSSSLAFLNIHVSNYSQLYASQDLFWPRLRRFIDVIYQYLSIVNPFGSKERILKTQPFISPAAKIYTAPTSKWFVVWEIYIYI